jgi:hypothetical protein
MKTVIEFQVSASLFPGARRAAAVSAERIPEYVRTPFYPTRLVDLVR